MKFTARKQDLEAVLGYAQRAVAARPVSAIMECILLTAEAGGVSLVGTDGMLTISTTPFLCDVEEEGSVALGQKLFSDIVKRLPGELVVIEVDERLQATIRSGRSVLRMPGLHGTDFPLPVMEDDEPRQPLLVIAEKLRDMIRQTIFSVSPDPTKPVLTGELLEIKESQLRVIAIDMFRISYRSHPLNERTEDTKAVVPARALGELMRMIGQDKDQEIEFFFTDTKAVFTCQEFTLASNLLHGDFIRYDQIFNDDFTTKIHIRREELMASCERVMLLTTEGRVVTMKLTIADDELTVHSLTEKGEVTDVIPVQAEGKELTIYFNPRYFVDVMRVMITEKVSIRFNSVMSPCTITGPDQDPGTKYLIVPLRPPQ